jgi:hypothetical protein
LAGVSSRWLLFLSTVLLFACSSESENILGTFRLDEQGSCANCIETGPRVMTYRAVAAAEEQPRYRFEFDGGQGHAGFYQLVATDTSDVGLILYPDSAGPFHQDVLGQAIVSQYRVRKNAIKAPCGGLFKQCTWRP